MGSSFIHLIRAFNIVIMDILNSLFDKFQNLYQIQIWF